MNTCQAGTLTTILSLDPLDFELKLGKGELRSRGRDLGKLPVVEQVVPCSGRQGFKAKETRRKCGCGLGEGQSR